MILLKNSSRLFVEVGLKRKEISTGGLLGFRTYQRRVEVQVKADHAFGDFLLTERYFHR